MPGRSARSGGSFAGEEVKAAQSSSVKGGARVGEAARVEGRKVERRRRRRSKGLLGDRCGGRMVGDCK